MIYAVGIGPGNRETMTYEAMSAFEESDVIVGYKTYIDLVKDLIKDKEVVSNGMKQEVDRVKKAIEISKTGKTVSVISSGDAGVYGMAGLILELSEDEEVRVISGVTASTAAAAVLGAPLMHDFCHISLSDLLTSLDLIYKRVALASEGDFVICIYNPRSKGRPDYLKDAFKIMKIHKSGSTPVGIVKNACRENQEVHICTIDTIDYETVDMLSIVIVGNSSTYIKNNKIITKRGYETKY
ncbi:precorrin-3B C(17)-methyltransferase [Sedimentibacter hydroxybenzoicus DSM 7310]|uniref:Precorrin-3B C(17)-methyltransferase n=1 Tax=Sedimentibacter hydroxybenzoicus DSM 7310 TaxID=1123245 RepID=A0A974GX01_SEDHY|nr:precorrin-3B C(17)-methyltransferase [Sedimentibacter hydroxybenzoicus]NYB75039.1 precorrin-3B C(17)-methyltransferase [Sedimentibacter hydroxybenzoicus DSM 7310]